MKRVRKPSSTQPEAYPSPLDGGPSITAIEDDSITTASSQYVAPSSHKTLTDSVREHVSMFDDKRVDVRPETREFYEHLDAFFEVKQSVETIAEIVMPTNAVRKYEDINPPDGLIIQECVPQAELQLQLDVLYAHAIEVKPRFDDFGRQLVQKVGLEPNAIMLEQADLTWYTFTAVPLKARDAAMKKAQYEGDARRLVDIVRASVVVDTEAAFEALVKYLYENYVANERDGVRVVRFKNHCKEPLADSQRDLLYSLGITLGDYSSHFVCELQIHMKQILEYKEATRSAYEYFRSYFKGGDGNVTARMELLAQFTGRDVDDISQILTSALMGDDDDQLDALDELFHKLSELEIVVLIRRRQLELISCWVPQDVDVELGNDWLILATRLTRLAEALAEQVMRSSSSRPHALLTQGKYDEAKPLLKRSLRIRQINLGDYDLDVTHSFNVLGQLFLAQGEYDDATPLYERSLRIRETNLGEHHPDVATSLVNLANLLYQKGKFDKAKPLFDRALRIRESSLGAHHPDVGLTLFNLALWSLAQGDVDDASNQIERAKHIFDTALGAEHPYTRDAHRLYEDIASRREAAVQP